jgi:hypothetical protein
VAGMGEVAREGKAMTKLGRIFAHETHEKHERRTEIFGVAREWTPMATNGGRGGKESDLEGAPRNFFPRNPRNVIGRKT